MHVHVTSFGYLHGPAPEATITLDLRTLLRDPHTDPAIRDLTGDNAAVEAKVMGTAGAHTVLNAVRETALASIYAANGAPVSIALGCAGGRHRSHVLAQQLALLLESRHGHTVTLTHRDAHRPVVHR